MKRVVWVNDEIYEIALDYPKFWDSIARIEIERFEPYKVLDRNAPFYR